MKTKLLLPLLCVCALTLATSTVDAGQRRGDHNQFVSHRSRPAITRTFAGGNRIAAWNGQHWNANHWNGQHWNNWNWHHHRRSFVFVDVGFPFWGWGYPYYYDYYPYGYYPYGYSYGYSGAYYDNGYYGSNNYGNGSNYNYGYTSGQDVAALQRKLADAGYYRGPIDGIMGSRTYYALKAYRHDHGNGNNNNGGYSPTLRDKPYSPPPVTTEPEPNE